MASVNERLQDAAIRHSLLLGRYGTGLANKVVRLLNGADEELVGKIAGRLATLDERGQLLSPKATKRLVDLLDGVRAINSAIYAKAHALLVDELEAFASAEAQFQEDALRASLSVDLDTKLPAPARLKAIVSDAPMEGRLLSSWVEGMEAGRVDRLDAAIRQGLVQSETTDQIVRRIRGTQAARYSDGILDISRRSAVSIVRTATTHVSNVTAQETWRANSHIVKAWQFLATLDNRTTITCSALSGQTFPIGEGPIPPRHIRCRSISVAVTKSFRELGLDQDQLTPSQPASMDGQVAGDTTFKDWLNKKGEETQDQVLGKTRAELFRTGKLDLAQFVRGDGSVLTLDELKSHYPGLLP